MSFKHRIMFQVSYALMILWFFAKTIYFTFYSMSYKVEGILDRQVKIINMVVTFIYCMFFCVILYNNNIASDEIKSN